MSSSTRLRALGALLVSGALAALPASAQDLGIGSKAPELSCEEWLKGSAVASLAPGQIYVVEFWATWCGPCLVTIPHLTELQKKYKDSKVTIIGVAGSEKSRDPAADLRTPLVKFIEDKGDRMAYTIAYDTDRSMSKAWMQAAKQGGIPTAFVVDGTGTIAWIGHPSRMDEPLAQIVAGKWDVQAEALRVKAAAEAELKAKPIVERYANATRAKEWDAALAAAEEIFALSPDLAKQYAYLKYDTLISKQEFAAAFAFADAQSKGVQKDEVSFLCQVAWSMVDETQAPRFEKKDLDLALRCALRAAELAKGRGEEPSVLDLAAAVHFAKGDPAQATEVQTRAVEMMKGKPGAEPYEKRLEKYKGAAKT